MKNLGLIALKSVYGRYLQAHDTDGEMHASNENRNEEETWFLFEVDPAQKIFALMNWRNGKFMSKKVGSPCAPANATVVSLSEQWELVDGHPFNAINAVAIKSVADGTYLGTNRPKDNATPCGGEVAAAVASPPPKNDGNWPGWWVMTSVDQPHPGRDAWNTIGGTVAAGGQQLLNNITPADVATIILSLV